MQEDTAFCVQIPSIVKATPDGDKRMVEICASREVVDGEGDVILRSALLESASSFVATGHIDIDHLSEIGPQLGIDDPGQYIIGVPRSVKAGPDGTTLVTAELQKGRPKADEVWGQLTATPPIPWRASIYGYPLPGQIVDCRVSKAEQGATRFLVKGISWRSLALTRHPINSAVDETRVITSKSFVSIMKSRMAGVMLSGNTITDLIPPPTGIEDLRNHFLHHINAGRCPFVNNTTAKSVSGFRLHFEKCCGEISAKADLHANALAAILEQQIVHQSVPTSVESSETRSFMTTPTDAASLFGAFAKLFKAIPTDKLEEIQSVTDMWNEPHGEHKIPSRAEIVTGPAEPMRGGNASSMVRQYSDTERQEGLVRAYERMDSCLAGIRKSIDNHDKALSAMAGVLGDVVKGFREVSTAVEKSATPPAATTVVVPEDSFLGKALGKIAKARVALRKADMADEEDEKEREERKSYLTAANDLLKSAKRLLAKAEDDDEDEDEDKMEKAVADLRSLSERAMKGLAVFTKAEEDEKERKEKEEAAEKATREAAEAATAKAAADAAAAAAAAETAVKSADTPAADAGVTAAKAEDDRVTKALAEGFGVVQSSLQDMMSTVMGRSAAVVQPPTFAKSAPVVDIQARLDEAIDNGVLETPADQQHAMTLLHRKVLADAGKMPMQAVLADIAASNDAIKQIFAA